MIETKVSTHLEEGQRFGVLLRRLRNIHEPVWMNLRPGAVIARSARREE